MTRFIDDDERRARLGRRHRLAAADRASAPLEVAESLTAIHGTDPGSTVFGIIARGNDISVDDVERALYEDRSIVRVLAMRRTVFAVPWKLAPAIWVSSAHVAREQSRLFHRVLAASGIDDPGAWLIEAERRLIEHLGKHPESISTNIAASDEYLGFRLETGAPSGGTQSAASRLLTYLSADGRVIRGRPRGSWTSSQFTWTSRNHWRSDWPELPSPEDADAIIARSWLAGHGPALVEDFAWWTGWAKGRSRKAFDRAGAVEVETTAGPAFVLADDLDPVDAPAPWIAFLPGLDSSTMGWRVRDFYLGAYTDRLFDNVGNGGPTVWADGRVIGGWTQLDSGQVVYELFEDPGSETRLALDAEADRITNFLGSVILKPRARRWTRTELALRSGQSGGKNE